MITNETQLSNLLIQAVKIAVDDTLEYFKERLIEIIDETVYSNEPEWYMRTFEFRSSWEVSKAELISSNIVEGYLYQNVPAMKWVAENFQHGNIYAPVTIQSEYALNEILNKGTTNAGFGFSPVEATHFWDIFMKEVDKDIESIFMKNLSKQGLEISGVEFNYTFS